MDGTPANSDHEITVPSSPSSAHAPPLSPSASSPKRRFLVATLFCCWFCYGGNSISYMYGLSLSRRTGEKRVVSVPLAEAEATRTKGAGECPPPSDSWAWRKYGQKPIKGSPYPRGYYRCSSSKGCPARKQVERSRVDPTMLVITYSGDHNHSWPLPKNQNQQKEQPLSSPGAAEEEPAAAQPSPADDDDKFSDLIADVPSLMLGNEFGWFPDAGSPSAASTPAAPETLLCAPPLYDAAAMLCADEGIEGQDEEEEEDSLFAGLGELPEFSMVFRRGMPAPAAAR